MVKKFISQKMRKVKEKSKDGLFPKAMCNRKERFFPTLFFSQIKLSYAIQRSQRSTRCMFGVMHLEHLPFANFFICLSRIEYLLESFLTRQEIFSTFRINLFNINKAIIWPKSKEKSIKALLQV